MSVADRLAMTILRVALGVTVLLLGWSVAAQAATVTLAWDASHTPVAGYIVSWGTQSGQHTNSLDVGNVTVAGIPLTGSDDLFYFVVRAYDSSGISNPSNETAAWVGTVSRTPSSARPGDFDGDGRADAMVYRGSSGEWFANKSSGGLMWSVWGAPALGDIAVPADYDGDGKTDVAVYRNTTGEWFLNRSRLGGMSLAWGAPALQDVPVPADYDGDGLDDVAVFRRASGQWFIRKSADGLLRTERWGAAGNDDVPVPGDYDGNGITDLAVYRRSTGQWFVLFDNSRSATWAWGSPSHADIPVPADYDGDGTVDVGVFRQVTGTWILRLSATNATRMLAWGAPTLRDVPVPGDYDGDGQADIAVYRASTGLWYIAYAAGGSAAFSWGAPAAGDTVGGLEETGVLPIQ